MEHFTVDNFDFIKKEVSEVSRDDDHSVPLL